MASDIQAVEALHVLYGSGQNLRRLHGGHLPAGLGQVAVGPQPCLQQQSEDDREKKKTEILLLITT